MNNNKESKILHPSEQETWSDLLHWDVSWYSSLNSEKVEQILDYNDQEILKIDEIMIYVWELDDMIKSWKKISNSMQYNFFVIWYNLLSDREKIHFSEIYNDLRIKYLEEKIRNNLVGNNYKFNIDLNNYFNELFTLLPRYDLSVFYKDFPLMVDYIDKHAKTIISE